MEVQYLFHVVNSGEVVMSNLPTELLPEIDNCSSALKNVMCPIYNVQKKHKKKIFENGYLYVCTYSEQITKRDFQQAFLLFESMLNSFIDFGNRVYGSQVKVLRHNVYDQLSHILDEMKYSISMDDISVGNWPQIVRYASNNVEDNCDTVAKSILKTIKCASIALSEFDAFEIVNSGIKPVCYKHSIHKVAKLSLQPYIFDFWDKGIRIELGESYDDVLIDYDSVNLSLNHFWNNALKYSNPNGVIEISFEHDSTKLIMVVCMVSLYIAPNEREAIFQKGYSGTEAKRLTLEGSGLGMYYIKKCLECSNCVFHLNAGDSHFNINGKKYAHNEFIFEFQSYC